MKQILSVVMALLCLGTASACLKKQPSGSDNRLPLTILVMDTTQALLPKAEVKIGSEIYKTSYDGRVVLQPEQMKGVKTFSVSCEGYQPVKGERLQTGVEPLIVRLVPKPIKEEGRDIYYTTGTFRSEARFTKEVMPMAVTGAHVAHNGVSAGKLTAGEVNDFTKWPIWPKVLDGSHQQYISEWKMEPRERYTVQVVNQSGYPVPNYPVSLLDTKGNTVFQAVTDNTGKAELWNGLIAPKVAVVEPQKTIVVDEPCDKNELSRQSDVDVMFVFDATGSMGDELRYLQAEMKDVIKRASAATGGLVIRTGAVVYRDHKDDYITRLSRLTEDIKTTQAFIDKQHADGGGDYPEAVPEALMAALNSGGWNSYARARIAFLILDAPCHQDSATLALLHDQVLNAAAQGVRLVPVVCSGLGRSGEYLLRAMALATNGTSFFLTDDSGIGDTHLKPTTDTIKVEHLNDMLVRTIVEFSYMPACEEEMTEDRSPITNEAFLPNPFDADDLEADPTIPHGEGVHYLLDVSGKLITIFEGEITDYQSAITGFHLPVGVYFIKTYYNGQWYTKKILVH